MTHLEYRTCTTCTSFVYPILKNIIIIILRCQPLKADSKGEPLAITPATLPSVKRLVLDLTQV